MTDSPLAVARTNLAIAQTIINQPNLTAKDAEKAYRAAEDAAWQIGLVWAKLQADENINRCPVPRDTIDL